MASSAALFFNTEGSLQKPLKTLEEKGKRSKIMESSQGEEEENPQQGFLFLTQETHGIT